jgi:hypothetical protein
MILMVIASKQRRSQPAKVEEWTRFEFDLSWNYGPTSQTIRCKPQQKILKLHILHAQAPSLPQ